MDGGLIQVAGCDVKSGSSDSIEVEPWAAAALSVKEEAAAPVAFWH